ncbi:hypothetical protein ABZY44_21825 [Streptomyces sp. NPDC006544]|uniref:hypothetical protein n=1 Tax=Streptomyces sp. NPDC006544 TaxID=3154583 RepID=UPI0033A42C3C
MSRLLVEIDGQTVPLTDCFWVRVDKSGCAYGSMVGHAAATPEQAHREFAPRARDRDRDVRQGYTIRLLTREQWRQQAQPCFLGQCVHRKAAA